MVVERSPTNTFSMKQPFKTFFVTTLFLCIINSTCKADTIDNYQIYIGKTLKLTEKTFNPSNSKSSLIKLDSSNYQEMININLSHCVHGETGRQLKLSDTSNKIIMIWELGNKEQLSTMSIPIIDILTNKAVEQNSLLELYYRDKEYPAWKLLTPVIIGQFDLHNSEKRLISTINYLEIIFYILLGLTIVLLLLTRARQKKSEVNR